jgi:hypothetical protein
MGKVHYEIQLDTREGNFEKYSTRLIVPHTYASYHARSSFIIFPRCPFLKKIRGIVADATNNSLSICNSAFEGMDADLPRMRPAALNRRGHGGSASPLIAPSSPPWDDHYAQGGDCICACGRVAPTGVLG